MASAPQVDEPTVRTLRRRFDDPAEIGEFFGDGVQYVPPRHGSYRLDAEFVMTPALSVEWMSHAGEVIVEEQSNGRQMFAVFGRTIGELRVDGDTARPGLVAAAATGQRVARLRGLSRYALLNVRGTWLDTRGQGLWHLDTSAEQQARLVSLIARVKELARQDDAATASLAAAGESIADALHGVVDGVERRPHPEPDQACQIVAQAIALIRADQAMSITDLTESVAASRSSLYRSFDRVLGISPYAYMQRRRLVRLRRRLLESDGGPGTVTREAANVGAFHLGNLARSYRDMFGESPHDTLARRPSTR